MVVVDCFIVSPGGEGEKGRRRVSELYHLVIRNTAGRFGGIWTSNAAGRFGGDGWAKRRA